MPGLSLNDLSSLPIETEEPEFEVDWVLVYDFSEIGWRFNRPTSKVTILMIFARIIRSDRRIHHSYQGPRDGGFTMPSASWLRIICIGPPASTEKLAWE